MQENIFLSTLLSKGYFPKELPITFTTNSFGLQASEIISDWESKKVFKKETIKLRRRVHKSNSYTYKLDNADIEVISKPKRGYERRNIHITHPIPQSLLSFEITKNWKSIQKWLLRQTFSLDEIRISNKYPRAIKGINFPTHNAKKRYLEATSDWLIKTDISRFYPTIYTHSIAWAAYGKENVKKNINLYKGSLADRIDILVRACNRNQTIGVPIGPETSRIIAEVISSRIDDDFAQKMSYMQKDQIDRLQDDWFIGAKTLEESETILATIAAIYRTYGFEINGSKTSITHSIATKSTTWTSEISAFLSHRSGPIRTTRLNELFSLGLRLQSDFPSEPVISYILSTVENQSVDTGDIEAVESFLLKAAIVSPISMDQICRIILSIQASTSNISRKRILSRFTVLTERNLENGNLFEAIWLLHTLRGLKVKLNSSKICQLAEITPSSSLALILLDMDDKDLLVRHLPKQHWEQQIVSDRVNTDWIWLLAYEGIRHNWLKDHTNVMSQPFFEAMRSRNVGFYDPNKSVTSSKAFSKTRKVVQRNNMQLMKRLLQEMRGIDFVDY